MDNLRVVDEDEMLVMIESHRLYFSSNFKKGKKIPHLSRMIIKNADFTGLNMAGMVVFESKLENCIFSDTELVGANFDSSILININFDRAALVKAEIGECKVESLSFSHTNLNRAWLVDLDLSKVNFENAMAIGTRFDECNLTGANFDGVQFRSTIMEECILDDNLKSSNGILLK